MSNVEKIAGHSYAPNAEPSPLQGAIELVMAYGALVLALMGVMIVFLIMLRTLKRFVFPPEEAEEERLYLKDASVAPPRKQLQRTRSRA